MKPAKHKYTILKQICQHIPAHLVSKLARSFGADKKARSFSPWSHVVAMLHVQIAHSLSLNDVADTLRNHSGVLTTIRRATPPSRNGLSHANRVRDPNMAQALFWDVLSHIQSKHPGFGRNHTARVEVNGVKKTMTFITNNTTWAPSSICDLYKCRWGVEVFFKQIKQTLQLGDFLGHSRNAILWQVWMALLAYVLIRFIGHLGQWEGTFSRLFTLLRGVLFSRLDAFSVMSLCGTARGSPRMIGSPQQAYLPGFELS